MGSFKAGGRPADAARGGDREVGRTHHGLIVRIGPDSYDLNDRIKIADPYWSESHVGGGDYDEEWVLELTGSEVRELVRLLMTALDEY